MKLFYTIIILFFLYRIEPDKALSQGPIVVTSDLRINGKSIKRVITSNQVININDSAQFNDTVIVSARVLKSLLNIDTFFQQNSDWNANSGVTKINNKPSLSTVAISGQYSDLTGSPTNLNAFTNGPGYISGITSSQIITALSYIPYNGVTNLNNYINSIPAQSFTSITGKPTTLSGYGIVDAYPLSGNPSSFLTTITSSQVTGALGYIPINGNGLSTQYIKADGTFSSFPSIPSAQVNSDWNSSSGVSVILNKPSLSTIAITGSYVDLTNKPSSLPPSGTASGDLTGSYPAPTLTTTGVSVGTYGSTTSLFSITVSNTGRVTSITSFNPKISKSFSGTTDASGNLTISFGTTFSVPPNVQVTIPNQTNKFQYCIPTSITTSACTVNAYSINSTNLLSVLLLAGTTNPVTGITVDILVTEK